MYIFNYLILGARIDMSKLTQQLAHKIKKYKPITNGIRHRVDIDRSELWKGRPVRELTRAMRKKGGRNAHGHITVRHRGGGHRRRYRKILLFRNIRAIYNDHYLDSMSEIVDQVLIITFISYSLFYRYYRLQTLCHGRTRSDSASRIRSQPYRSHRAREVSK